MRRLLKSISVRATIGDRARGTVEAGAMRFDCALGPAGIVVRKREGDGATPRATLPVRRLWRRADRGPCPRTRLPVRIIRRNDGWCDDLANRRYNRLIQKPFSASHEDMWRNDGLYDLVVELGWNDRPAIRGRGSAIFMHAARPGMTPTAGCVALRPPDLRKLLAALGPKTRVKIAARPRKTNAR